MTYTLHCYFSIPRKHCLNEPAPAVFPDFPLPQQSYWTRLSLFFRFISFSFSSDAHFPHALAMDKNKQVFFRPSFLIHSRSPPKTLPNDAVSHGYIDNPALKHKYSCFSRTLLAFSKLLSLFFLWKYSVPAAEWRTQHKLHICSTFPSREYIVIWLVSPKISLSAHPTHTKRWSTGLMWTATL